MSKIKLPDSVKLTAEQKKQLKKFRTRFTSTMQCAKALKLDRGTFRRILIVGSGSAKNIKKITSKLVVTAPKKSAKKKAVAKKR